VFQQLNGAAAATIFNRVRAAIGAEVDGTALTPAAVAAADVTVLRACGLSQNKTKYLTGLATAFTTTGDGGGGLSDEALENMDQKEVYDTLIALHGLGPWWGCTS
jgi:DNA-3-methyladenine glycosylase II